MTPRAPSPAAERGFTMIELLITLAVTTIGLVGLLTLHTTLSRSNDASARQLEATAIGDRILEANRGFDQGDMTARYGALPIEEDLDVVEGRGGLEFRPRLVVRRVVEAPTALLNIRVEVAWTDGDAEPGAEGGVHDHRIAAEVLRAAEGSL